MGRQAIYCKSQVPGQNFPRKIKSTYKDKNVEMKIEDYCRDLTLLSINKIEHWRRLKRNNADTSIRCDGGFGLITVELTISQARTEVCQSIIFMARPPPDHFQTNTRHQKPTLMSSRKNISSFLIPPLTAFCLVAIKIFSSSSLSLDFLMTNNEISWSCKNFQKLASTRIIDLDFTQSRSEMT